MQRVIGLVIGIGLAAVVSDPARGQIISNPVVTRRPVQLMTTYHAPPPTIVRRVPLATSTLPATVSCCAPVQVMSSAPAVTRRVPVVTNYAPMSAPTPPPRVGALLPATTVYRAPLTTTPLAPVTSYRPMAVGSGVVPTTTYRVPSATPMAAPAGTDCGCGR